MRTRELWRSLSFRPPTGREVHEKIEENDAESNHEPLRGRWRREKLRQGLLTGSDGYHFIHDTILRLPQPTSLPSPSSMPPTTDLIWSYPSYPDPPSTFYPPPFFVYYLTWSRRPCLSREVFLTSDPLALVFPQYPQHGYRRWLVGSIPKTPFPSWSLNGAARGDGRVNLKISIYSLSVQIVKTHSLSLKFVSSFYIMYVSCCVEFICCFFFPFYLFAFAKKAKS